MKHLILVYILLISLIASGQKSFAQDQVLITEAKGKTRVSTNDKGRLLIEVSQTDACKIQKRGVVQYNDFGALGDGKTDDIDAIAAAHAYANHHQLPVQADGKATYYIGGKSRTAIINTNTDFSTAQFIIDDRNVQSRSLPVFSISSGLKPYKIEGISSLIKNQYKLKLSFPGPCLVLVNDTSNMRFIRMGRNQNNGRAQTDVFIVDKAGNVDSMSPIIWDFDRITSIVAKPVDQTTLTIKGGIFTTIANQAKSEYSYYSRGIVISRSNVLVDGLKHYITGEGEQGAPYGGFISIRDCAYVTVSNSVFTGHKMYETIGAAGLLVSMGSYGIASSRSLYVSFVNCSQTNDINDPSYWGLMISDYSKNLLLDYCSFSRFDAHMGVVNATIRNSTLGHQGINITGRGLLIVENTTIHRASLVYLRGDYGSTWEGEFHFRNCVLKPGNRNAVGASLIAGFNSGQHNFGYTCYMPEKITIENLHIDDSNHPDDYHGPAIFGNFNPQKTDELYVEAFPYQVTKEVVLKNVTTTSGKPLRLSDNQFMFRNVKVINN
jgi:hypothetical protein